MIGTSTTGIWRRRSWRRGGICGIWD